MKLVSLVVIAFTMGNVKAQLQCNIVNSSGNVTIKDNVAMAWISEKQTTKSEVCSLEVEGKQKIATGLDNTYFSGVQFLLPDDTTGFNLSLVSSVDDVADKPSSIDQFTGYLQCRESNLLPPISSAAVQVIAVSINLVNDHTPNITGDSFVIPALPETFPFGVDRIDLCDVYKLNIQARDGDTAGDLSSKVHFVMDDNKYETFSAETTVVNVDADNEYFLLRLYLIKPLDYQKISNYTLIIQAMDEGTPPLSSSISLFINVKPGHILGPIFDSNFYRASINESVIDGKKHDINMEPEEIQARDPETGSAEGIVYSILVDDCGKSCEAVRASFTVNGNTGRVTFDSAAPFDDINNHVAVFAVKATANDTLQKSSLSVVTVILPASVVTTTTDVTVHTTDTTPTTDVTAETTRSSASESPGTSSASESPGTSSASESPGTSSASESPVTSSASESPGTSSASESPVTSSASESPGTSSASESPGTSSAIPQSTSQRVSPGSSSFEPTTCPAAVTTETTVAPTTWPPSNPSFSESFQISVDTLVNTVVVRVAYESGTTGRYKYSATDCDGEIGTEYYKIDAISGDVSVQKQLIAGTFCLNVTAEEIAGKQTMDFGTVVIEASGYSYEEIFAHDYYEAHIDEDSDSVTLLVDLNSTFEERHMESSYEIMAPYDPSLFYIDASTGRLFVLTALDHETNPLYRLLISANLDWTIQEYENVEIATPGNQSRNEVVVKILVDDINDNAPIFDVGTTYTIGVTSYLGQGQTVMTVKATDADDSAEFRQIYYLVANESVPFAINICCGLLRATKSLDLLSKSGINPYELTIIAANSEDGTVMPTHLHLRVFTLKPEEILVMKTLDSVTDFDGFFSTVYKIFRENLTVDARIIQWEINEDDDTVLYFYILPLVTDNYRRRRDSDDDRPLEKDEILDLIKKNRASLEDYFVTDSAKTYDELPSGKHDGSDVGLLAAVVVLSVLITIGLLAATAVAFVYCKKRQSVLRDRAEPVDHNDYSTSTKYELDYSDKKEFESDNLEATNQIYENIEQRKSFDKVELLEAGEDNETNRKTACDNEAFEEESKTPAESCVSPDYSTTQDCVQDDDGKSPEPEPELDYLKSILVHSNEKSETKHAHKSVVKFADVTEVTVHAEVADEIFDEKL